MVRLLALVALISASCARAGIYGTSPVADTLLSAGRISTVTWRDDQREPSLYEMGPIKLDLYVGEVSAVPTVLTVTDMNASV